MEENVKVSILMLFIAVIFMIVQHPRVENTRADETVWSRMIRLGSKCGYKRKRF